MELDLIISVQGKDIPTLVAVSSGQVSHNEKEKSLRFFYFWHKIRHQYQMPGGMVERKLIPHKIRAIL